MVQISVIVPVYNVEEYVGKCLDSILAQTHTELEIICVNDASTDNSGNICDEYALKDSRIKVFHNETNKGVSASRNIGLVHMTGKYVGFVDADDWIEPDMYEVLYGLIEKHNVSFSCCGLSKDTDTKIVCLKNENEIPEKLISQKDILTCILRRDYYCGFNTYCWNKLYASEFINKHNLKFDTEMARGEDVYFNTIVALTDDCSCAYSDRSLYHYYQRSTSAVNSNSISQRLQALSMYKKVIDLLVENGYEDIAIWIKRQYAFLAGESAEKAIENNDDSALELMREHMEKYADEYFEVNSEYSDRVEWFNKLLVVNIKQKSN